MSEELSTLEQRLAELKRGFDESFRQAAGEVAPRGLRLALVRAGGKRYALRVSELAGLEPNRRIVPLPSRLAGLLGLSAVRGRLVPVFGLAALLGESVGAEPARWLALYDAVEVVGLAFEEFEGSRDVGAAEVQRLAPGGEPPGVSPEALRVEGGLVPVLDLGRVVSRIGSERATAGNEGGEETRPGN